MGYLESNFVKWNTFHISSCKILEKYFKLWQWFFSKSPNMQNWHLAGKCKMENYLGARRNDTMSIMLNLFVPEKYLLYSTATFGLGSVPTERPRPNAYKKWPFFIAKWTIICEKYIKRKKKEGYLLHLQWFLKQVQTCISKVYFETFNLFGLTQNIFFFFKRWIIRNTDLKFRFGK